MFEGFLASGREIILRHFIIQNRRAIFLNQRLHEPTLEKGAFTLVLTFHKFEKVV